MTEVSVEILIEERKNNSSNYRHLNMNVLFYDYF